MNKTDFIKTLDKVALGFREGDLLFQKGGIVVHGDNYYFVTTQRMGVIIAVEDTRIEIMWSEVKGRMTPEGEERIIPGETQKLRKSFVREEILRKRYEYERIES